MHHTVITDVEPNLPMVQIDGVLIEQVITNLLENAAKYTPEGSTITISVTRSGNDVQTTIEDNGPGIPSGDEVKIFNKFYTAGQQIAQKGTGLGLAICYAIINIHHGTIKAENRMEGGARFSFTLPATYYKKTSMEAHD